MIRESKMPAILKEDGFMDSTTDIGALRSDMKLKALGEAIADGLANYFKLKPKVGQKLKYLMMVSGYHKQKYVHCRLMMR